MLEIKLSRTRKFCARCMQRKTYWVFHYVDEIFFTMPFRICWKCINENKETLRDFRNAA